MEEEEKKKSILEATQGAIDGDEVAFSQLYKNYLTPLYRYLFVRVKDNALAEDLTQVVFLRAFEHRGALRKEAAKPLAYLYTIARNVLIDYWKKKKEIQQSDAADIFEKTPDITSGPKEMVEHQDLAADIITGLAKLTEDQREAVSLKYLHDFSISEIAKQMDRSEESVRQLQCRGLKALRAYIHL